MRGNEFLISHWKTFQVHFVNNLSGSTICTISHLYFSSSEAALHDSFFRRTYLSLCSQPPAKHLLLRPDALLNLPRIWKRKKKHADASGFQGEEQPGCGRRGISAVSLPFATTIVSANTLCEGWTLLIFETFVARETHSLVLGQCTTYAFDTIDL